MNDEKSILGRVAGGKLFSLPCQVRSERTLGEHGCKYATRCDARANAKITRETSRSDTDTSTVQTRTIGRFGRRKQTARLVSCTVTYTVSISVFLSCFMQDVLTKNRTWPSIHNQFGPKRPFFTRSTSPRKSRISCLPCLMSRLTLAARIVCTQ